MSGEAGGAAALAKLRELASRDQAQHLFALLDCARDALIHPELLASDETRACLYTGRLSPAVEATAPWAVDLWSGQGAFAGWLTDRGWGKSFGVYLLSAAPIEGLRAHFRQFLMVETEDGRSLYFRFYDPRVLRVYLPTCTPDELETVFGPVSAFMMEARQPGTLLCFARKEDGTLERTEHSLAPPAPAEPSPAEATTLEVGTVVTELKTLRERMRTKPADDAASLALARDGVQVLKSLLLKLEGAKPKDGDLEPVRVGLRQAVSHLELRSELSPKVVDTRLASLLVRMGMR